MANDYQNNTNKKLLKQFAAGLESSTVLSNTVSKQLVNDFDASTGRDYGQVSMKRPPQYNPQRTSDGNMTVSGTTNPVQTGKVQAEVSDYITVYVENTQVEEALEADQLQELLKPIAEDMVITLEGELALYMAKNASLISGDPDSSIAEWKDIANAGALLKEIGAPTGKKYGVVSNFTQTDLADLQTQLGVNSEVGSAWDDAVIKRNFGGLNDILTTNNLPEYTAGTASAGITLAATPLATYVTYANTYQMTLSLAGLGAGETLNVGQVLEFPATFLTNMRNHKQIFNGGAGVPFTGTVLTGGTADGGGLLTVVISGAAIYDVSGVNQVNAAFNTVTRGLTSGDSVSVMESTAGGIYRPSLAYCEGFVGMGSVVLPKLHATDSMIMNHKGMSIRVHKFSDGEANKNRYRFDMLPTFATFNPSWGVKMHGIT
ncbi:MAG: P22 phage major capsid protein family protein [Oleispira sp.]